MIALHDVPSIVAALLHNIDFFKLVLSHVGYEQPARASVKREAPRIAEANGIDFRKAAASGERIISWNCIRLARAGGIHINPHHLSRQCLRILPMAKGVARAAAIAQAEIKKAVWPKRELACLVVRKVVDLING